MTTTVSKLGGRRVYQKMVKRLIRGSNMSTGVNRGGSERLTLIRRKVWLATSADPAVDTSDADQFPVQLGEPVYRYDTDEVFICSVKPTINTAATFIQIHA